MPNYKFDKVIAVKIESDLSVYHGQEHRSSDNYDFRKLKKGPKLTWICPDGISFDVMEDKSAAKDPVTFSNVKNGTITNFPNDSQANGLYIANPKNPNAGSGTFVIEAKTTYYADPWNWMSALPDSISISELSIPGTHDSCAIRYVSSLGRCQTISIEEQLCFKGVRFLDIRCKVADDNKLHIYHGPIDENLCLDDVLTQCKGFLNDNPKETIIMSIKNEGNSSDNDKFDKIFYDQYYENDSIWYAQDTIPDLGTVRGKIVLFRRFVSNHGIGINASPDLWKNNAVFEIVRNDKNINVQDKYSVEGASIKYDIYLKPSLMESTNTSKWYINFASAINSTEIPPNAATISNYINPLLNDFFDNNNFFGVILMDYIDQNASGDCLNISSKIISLNFIKSK